MSKAEVKPPEVKVAEPVKEHPPIAGINPARMESAEYKRTTWVAIATPGSTPIDLMRPEYWAHVAEKMKVWDKIEIRANDGAWYAEVVVVDVSRQWARINPLLVVDLTTKDVSMSQAAAMNKAAQYTVVHRGEHCKWSVVRNSDMQVVHEFEETQAGAMAWMTDRQKAG